MKAIGRTSFDSLKSNTIYVLKKSPNLLRDIKGLDKKTSRELFKAAVLYIKPEQEDEQEILLNDRGSEEYENFLSSLGWEVNFLHMCDMLNIRN